MLYDGAVCGVTNLMDEGDAWPRKDCVLMRSRVLWGIFVLVVRRGKWICDALTARLPRLVLLEALWLVLFWFRCFGLR